MAERHSETGNGNKQSGVEKLSQRKKVLGPVQNLEEHVRADWWHEIFNSLYLKTDGDVVDDLSITREEADLFLGVLNPSPEDDILDLCCGQGRHSLELARRGFKHVEGIDRSHYLIQKAKAQAKKEGLHVKFREGDARKLPFPADTFDIVMILGNSFGYFETVHEDMMVLKEIFRVLKPWGKLLVDVADGEYVKNHFQPRSWEWMDKKRFVCRERSLSAGKQRLISREVITHVSKGVIADQFYAERLYTRKSLSELIKTAGFSEFNFHGEISTRSHRNQDLGMMAKRIIGTCQVRKEWTPIRRRSGELLRNVAVIMGDPHKLDPLKPSYVFDDDDLYTIDQLKSALRELKDYQFIYLNNHDTLFEDLRRLRGKIDLAMNLCDEGYQNDPRKELHIPVFFEKLDIPYTGSGPQCLAYCYDKSLIRGIAREMNIPVPKAHFIKPGNSTFKVSFPFPVIVKPNFGDSSYGITRKNVVNTPEELVNVIGWIREECGYDSSILVEEFLTGKDLTVGIIGNTSTSYTVLPITEEDYSAIPEDWPKICGYEAKWVSSSPYWNIKSKRADLPEKTQKSIEEWCLALFHRLGCWDYARLDWRLDAHGNPRLLEVNPNPGWCWDGHLAKMCNIMGLSYSDMLKDILEAAEQRVGIQPIEAVQEKQVRGGDNGLRFKSVSAIA